MRVRPVCRHRIPRIREPDDGGVEWDVVPVQPVRISETVPALVVVTNSRNRVLERRDLGHDLRAPRDVLSHDRGFARLERPGFRQDRVGDADLSHVVEESRCSERSELLDGEGELTPDGERDTPHAL